MSWSRWLLRAALALPIVLLASLAVRQWHLEGAQLELEYRSSVRATALGIVARLERWRDGEPWPGELLAGAGAPPLPDVQQPQETADRLELLGAQLARAADDADAAAVLDRTIANSDDPTMVSWARLRRAALAERSGDAALATQLRRAVADGEEFADGAPARDDRGLRLDLAARSLLLFAEPSAAAAAAVVEQLAADLRFAEQLATVALCERALAIHAGCENDPSARARLAAQVTAHRQRAAWNSLRRTLDATSVTTATLQRVDGYGGFLVAAQAIEQGTRVRGLPLTALQQTLFGDTTAELIEALGVQLDLVAADGSCWASTRSDTTSRPAADYFAREELPGGLGAVAVAASTTGEAAGRRQRSRAGWLWATALAVTIAVLAGTFGLRALRQQERLNADRAGFIAAVSHELKTPLTATRLLGELLERGDVDAQKVREFGGRIARESERLDQLVRGVLDLARIEKVGLEPGRAEQVTPAELFAEAVERHVLARGARRTPAVKVLDSDPALRVYVDREAVLGALSNLLENAVVHAGQSEVVELQAVRHDDRVRFEVRDRGPGVPPAEREAIFTEFRRGGSEDTRRTRGAGIGLALVARIARAHGGTAWCDPRDGGGSVFVLELPRARQEATA